MPRTIVPVRDVMTKDPIRVGRADALGTIANLFDENGISGLPVVDAADRLVGIVSKTDVLHRCLEGPQGARPGVTFFDRLRAEEAAPSLDPEDLGVAEDFMTTDPVTARPDESLYVAASRMAKERVHRVIVVDEESRPVGILTTFDVLQRFPG